MWGIMWAHPYGVRVETGHQSQEPETPVGQRCEGKRQDVVESFKESNNNKLQTAHFVPSAASNKKYDGKSFKVCNKPADGICVPSAGSNIDYPGKSTKFRKVIFSRALSRLGTLKEGLAVFRANDFEAKPSTEK